MDMMINLLNIDAEATYAIGDIHGNFNNVVSFMYGNKLTGSCIIVCGDCGLGFNTCDTTKDMLSELYDAAMETNNRVVMFRGNHDDPAYFNNGFINSEHVIAVPDYTVLNYHILLVGGAISVDRQNRKVREQTQYRCYKLYSGLDTTLDEYRKAHGCIYWDDESPVYDESALNQLNDHDIRITHVCTHTCPSFCKPVTKDGIRGWLNVDETLESDLNLERNVMDMIHDKLVSDGHPLSDWVYGHFHEHNTEFINGVRYTMLNMSAKNSKSDGIDYIEIR